MAKPFAISGTAAPLPLNNLDTDQIMPKQFLLGIDKSGLAKGVLYDLRYDEDGRPRERFVLNQPQYANARILVTGSNFGCGSSREHAVWGLQQAGFDAVIAPGYGEIFYFNATNNRLLVVTLPLEQVEALVAELDNNDDKRVSIDVDNEVVVSASGKRYTFTLPARQKQMLVDGLDMVSMTLRDADRIAAFEAEHARARPWCAIDLPAQQQHR